MTGAGTGPTGDELAKPDDAPGDLKRKTARGALASVVGQAATFVLRIGSMVVIARLVTPEQFGVVGMVTAFTGLLNLLRDGGLPQATIQKAELSGDLASTLFWMNLGIGFALATLTAVAAPVLVAFYSDSRLFWITIAMGAAFILNGASAQHRAILQRGMRFGELVVIDVVSLVASIIVGIWMAVAGFGYWALVGMTLAMPAGAMIGVWIRTRWIPGSPRLASGAGSMLRYGGLITLNSVVVYVAYNLDKVLLGRFWGAEVLGLYGRAYQLISIPTENLQSAMGWVMFPALARVQTDPDRLRSYFLKGYSLFLSAVFPITVACGLFARDIVGVLLGPQWDDAVPIFQFLAPTILAFALLNPMAYLMQATGRALRSLKLAFLIAPVVILGYALGLSRGPTGVALGFSVAMLILVAPAVHWAKQGTLITAADLGRAVLPALVSVVAGAAAALAVALVLPDTAAFVRLILLTAVLFGTHGLVLLFGLRQKETYLDMLRAMRDPRDRSATLEGQG